MGRPSVQPLRSALTNQLHERGERIMASPHFTAEELEREEWRVIQEFPNYAVSNLGRVRREVDGIGTLAGQLTVGGLRKGYRSVGLRRTRGGHRFHCSVHRLVARAFLGEPPKAQPCVNHINGIKTDNRVENLEWSSVAENEAHAARTGLKSSGLRSGRYTKPEATCRGERHPSAKLRADDIPVIRTRHAAGDPLPALAADYGVTKQSIWRIVHGTSWKHLP